MRPISINELAVLTGKDRRTIGKAVSILHFEHGEYRAKLYDSAEALEVIYGQRRKFGHSEDSEDAEEAPTELEARRLLQIARRQEIELNMEVTRKQRIPIGVVNSVNDEVIQYLVSVIKANKGKEMSEEAINDMLAAFRAMPEKLKWKL